MRWSQLAFIRLVVIAVGISIAWKFEHWSEHTEHILTEKHWFAIFLKVHFFFFLAFFFVEMILDAPKDWLKAGLQRRMLRYQFEKLARLFSEDQQELFDFCLDENLSTTEINDIIEKRMYSIV